MIAQQLVINGDFESQSLPDGSAPLSWVCSSGVMLNSPSDAYSGSWCASMGSADNATYDLYQTVSIPADAITTLSCWVSVVNKTAKKDTLYNTLTLKIRGADKSDLTTLRSWTNQDSEVAQGYKHYSFDVSAYAGQTIQVYFTAATPNPSKITTFYVDLVSLEAILNLPASSYPPLISDKSRDIAGNIQLYGSEVLCSTVLHAEPDDPFFHPELGLNGYAYNGYRYKNGVQVDTNRAEWWLEAAKGGDQISRGSTQDFPVTLLCLATSDSISLLDVTDNLTMWAIFKKGHTSVYSDTFGLDPGAEFIPQSISYAYGAINILLVPVEGSLYSHPVSLMIDYANDFVYADVAL